MSRASLRRADEDARRLGLLVARNVEKGMGEGRPPKETVPRGTVSEKVSARQFANTSGTSADRVLEAATRPP